MNRTGLLAICLLSLVACDSGPPPQPVVVYAPEQIENGLQEWFASSDFEVTLVTGDIATLTDSIIAKQDSPRADVLITSNAIDMWRAGDEGALRPIRGDALATIPAQLRDPDGAWAAFGKRYLNIAVGPGAEAVLPRSYEDLGNTEHAGRVCLVTSALPVSRLVMAMLIEDHGVKPAERIVRRWVRNLAQVPFASEAELIAALESGDCYYGIVTRPSQAPGVVRVKPTPAYVDILAVGVSRHAANADGAQALVDWMLTERSVEAPAGTNGLNVSIAGWRNEEARLLAERAGYR